jgi:Uma2 family endonuclease
MAANNFDLLNEADYLRIERTAEIKSEFYAGKMRQMLGGTRWHSLITTNITGEIGSLLKGRNSHRCVIYGCDLRIKVEETGLYTYPDASVACEEKTFADQEMDTLLNPILLVEVLSDLTEAYDRGKKFEHYRLIPSLREYLLISQREPRIEQFIRQPSGDWLLHEAIGLESSIHLPSIDITLPLSEVFAKVVFSPQPIREDKPPKR